MIDISYQDIEDVPEKRWITAVVKAVLTGEETPFSGTLSIVMTNDACIQALNRDFFGKDRPTDVIAFPLDDEDDDIWGELYVSTERAADQAGEYGVSLFEETARLLIHGVLHLHGYDDKDDRSRERMTVKENHYLDRLKTDGII
ncbi:rRNA maturation RNase YbeY [bacterium]|nr:rRNA maturation RNase YbeY [bacterium]